MTLLTGEKFAPIPISIGEVRFEEAVQYRALSYTWAEEDGDASLLQKIDCDGSTVRVTNDCEAAL